MATQKDQRKYWPARVVAAIVATGAGMLITLDLRNVVHLRCERRVEGAPLTCVSSGRIYTRTHRSEVRGPFRSFELQEQQGSDRAGVRIVGDQGAILFPPIFLRRRAEAILRAVERCQQDTARRECAIL